MGIQGQDWASYQDLNPPVSGIDFVFIKITQGLTYTNPRWPAQYRWAVRQGLVVGLYHYPNMNHRPLDELNHYLQAVRSVVDPATPGLLHVLDWEGYDQDNHGVSDGDQAAYKEAWLKAAKAALPHNPVGLYCNVDYWKHVDATGNAGDFLWIADPTAPIGQPHIVAPWLFHQYGEHNSTDLDYCPLATRADLAAWAHSFHPEDDMTPQQAQQLADLHKALVEPTLKSRVDGGMHTLSEHVLATNQDAREAATDAHSTAEQLSHLQADVARIKQKLGI